MKILLKYILAFTIPLLWLLGCKDTAYPDDDAEFLLVEATGVAVSDINKVRPMPDGSMLVPLKTADSVVYVAKIHSNGSTTYSDSLPKDLLPSEVVVSDNLIVSPSGECLVVNDLKGYGEYAVSKLDASGCLVFYDKISTNHRHAIVTMLDNGDIAYFNSAMMGSDENTPFKMGIVGNNFKYTINSTTTYDAVVAFDGILVAYSQISTENSDYLLFRPDGTVTGGGTFDVGTVSKVQYIGGYLYFLLHAMDFDLEDLSSYESYYVAKMDLYGNLLYCEKIDANDVTGNFTVQDGKLITTGKTIIDEEKNTNCGAVFVIDDHNGKLLSTVPMDYLGCVVLPLYVTPCKDGGYCVYAVRREHFDETTSGKGVNSTKEGGMLYIYRAEQLIELNINK